MVYLWGKGPQYDALTEPPTLVTLYLANRQSNLIYPIAGNLRIALSTLDHQRSCINRETDPYDNAHD